MLRLLSVGQHLLISPGNRRGWAQWAPTGAASLSWLRGQEPVLGYPGSGAAHRDQEPEQGNAENLPTSLTQLLL